MDILAVDYGEKKMGLACAQKELGVVTPFGVIRAESESQKISKLISLIEKENIEELIIGMPYSADGEENRNTKKVKKFASKIREKTDIKIEFVDERYSSQEADSMKGEATRDEKSAMVILSHYLD